MDTPTQTPPEPPAQPSGTIPRWLAPFAKHKMLIAIVGATGFIMWSTHWTNGAANETQLRANTTKTVQSGHLVHDGASSLSGAGPNDQDEEIAAKQAAIDKQQRELAAAIAARQAQSQTVGVQGQQAAQMSTEQQALAEMRIERMKNRYNSLWSAPIIATADRASNPLPPTQLPPGATTPSPAAPVATSTGTTPALPAGDPNKSRFAYDDSIGPYHVIQRYTMIGGTLMNQVNSQTGGVVMIRLDRGDTVYVPGTKTVLWPEGSILEGEAKTITATNQNLVGVSIERVRMPDGYAIAFPPAAALSQNGQTGVAGQVNNHILSNLGWSILLAGFAGLSEIGNSVNGFGYNPEATFRAEFAQSAGQQAQQQLFAKLLNRPATVIIPIGTRCKSVLSEDQSGVPEYANHRIVPGSI